MLQPRWDGPIIVAATGKSLTTEVAEACMASGCPIIAVKQAVLRLPTADVLYACDAHHWDAYQGYPMFEGERWSTHGSDHYDNKLAIAKKYRVRLVRGKHGKAFSSDPAVVNYGNNAAFQGIGLAIHWLRGLRKQIVLVGLDLRGAYFYGHHPRWGTNDPPLGSYLPCFEAAAKALPEGIEVVLATPSALKCFRTVELNEALSSPTT